MYNYKKNISKNLSGIRVKLFLTVFFLLCLFSAQAQFTITEDFRGSGSPDIVIDENAYLTSGTEDVIGSGWLRLTKALGNQRGYAYVNKSFPSTMGLLIDFEYTMWRDITKNPASDNNYLGGGDGLSMYLFDATYGPGTFQTGFYGGSLGYANVWLGATNSSNRAGLTGGYLGLGFDSYGNYTFQTEGKPGGASGQRPNSISLRGRTTTTNPNTSPTTSLTNQYLSGISLTGTTPPFTITPIPNGTNPTPAGNKDQNIIDYNTIRSAVVGDANYGRPPQSLFYRRVQLEVIPTTANTYRIIVRWATSYDGAFTQLMDYTTTDLPPGLLKMGFAASSGGAVNYHEIRNLLITTPNNLRIIKKANKDILRSVPAGNNANEISYTIELVNDTNLPYTNASFVDELVDVDGNAIPATMFTMNPNLTVTGANNHSLVKISGQNRITGNITIPANTTAYVRVTGTLSVIPPSNILTNRVTVLPTGNDKDFDLSNNTAEINLPVIAENVDLLLQKTTIGAECIDATIGNTYEVNVINMGIEAATYRRTGSSNANNSKRRIVITKVIPAGYRYNDASTPGGFTTTAGTVTGNERWFRSPASIPSGVLTTPLTVTYVARGAADSDQTLAGGGTVMPYPIRYTIIPPANTSYIDQTSVEYRAAVSGSGTAYNGVNLESSYNPPNTANNTHSQTIYAIPPVPTLASATIYYCLGENASQLSASTTFPDATLTWYLNPGGTPVNVAPTPVTNTTGTTTYYVSQKRGNCESAQATINVIVLPTPTAGAIAGTQTTCSSGSTTTITSTTAGQATGWPTGTTIMYRWESSADGSTGWSAISGATSDTYSPGALITTTHYRRITIATIGTKSCTSAVTNTVVKTVNTVDGGAIAGDQTLCSGAFSQITSSTSGSSSVAVTYRWESSTTGTAGSWTTISGATAATYVPVNTVTTYFRRITISTVNSVACEAASNVVVKAVNSVAAGTITGNQTVCSGSSFSEITSTLGTGAGAITYRWENSATGTAGSWSTISAATAATYTPVNTTTTHFRRVTISTLNGVACEAISNVIIKTVNAVNAGVIAGNQDICTGVTPTQLTSTTNGSAPTGSNIAYRWESSTTGTGGWSTISNTNSATYTPVNTTTMYFRRVTVSTLNSVPCEAASNVITVAFKNCKMVTNPMIRQRTK